MLKSEKVLHVFPKFGRPYKNRWRFESTGLRCVGALHGVQSVAASLPSVVRYVPASQSWHASAREAPEAWPYLPLAHKMHEEMEFAPVVVENEPPAQGTQTFAVDAPSTEEYVPAAQKIQSASA